MQTRIKGLFIVLMAALLVVVAFGCTGRNASQPVKIRTVLASNQELDASMELSGVLIPAQTVAISSKITGQVVQLGCTAGQAVKKGEVLIQLDTQALDGQLLQAQASLEAAEAGAQAAQNQAAIARVNLDAAQKTFDQMDALYRSGGVSQSQRDDAKNKLDIAGKQYDNAAGPSQNQAQAAIHTAQANLKSLQVQHDNATIRSPLDGIVSSRNVNVGEVVSSGVAVISLVDTTTVKLKSTISQDLLPRLSQGQELNIVVDAFPGRTFPGKVETIGPIALSTGEVFPVEIAIQNDGSLLAGMSARATVVTKNSGISIPTAALVQNNGTDYVFVIKDNQAYRREVTIGTKNQPDLQVTKGLEAGERVAVSNVGSLSDNTPVKVDE